MLMYINYPFILIKNNKKNWLALLLCVIRHKDNFQIIKYLISDVFNKISEGKILNGKLSYYKILK